MSKKHRVKRQQYVEYLLQQEAEKKAKSKGRREYLAEKKRGRATETVPDDATVVESEIADGCRRVSKKHRTEVPTAEAPDTTRKRE